MVPDLRGPNDPNVFVLSNPVGYCAAGSDLYLLVMCVCLVAPLNPLLGRSNALRMANLCQTSFILCGRPGSTA